MDDCVFSSSLYFPLLYIHFKPITIISSNSDDMFGDIQT